MSTNNQFFMWFLWSKYSNLIHSIFFCFRYDIEHCQYWSLYWGQSGHCCAWSCSLVLGRGGGRWTIYLGSGGGKLSCPNVQIFLSRWLPFLASVLYTAVHPEPRMLKLHSFVNFSITAHCWWCWVLGSKSRSSTSREKKFYHQFSIVKYSYLPTDTFRNYVEMHVT